MTMHTYIVALKLDIEAESPIQAAKIFMSMLEIELDPEPVLEVRQFVDTGEDWKACSVDTYDYTIGDEWMQPPDWR